LWRHRSDSGRNASMALILTASKFLIYNFSENC